MKQNCQITILSIGEPGNYSVANEIDQEYDVGISNDISVGRKRGAHLNIVRIRVDRTSPNWLLSGVRIKKAKSLMGLVNVIVSGLHCTHHTFQR